MVFCIDKEKCEKLSDYLSQLIKLLKEKDEIDAVFMNSYFIHIPVNSFFDQPGIVDGINIKLTMVCNTDLNVTNEQVKELKSKILEELNYGISISGISKDVFIMQSDRLKHYLNDADVIFDKTGDVTRSKNMIFMLEKSEDAITYQPRLNIRS